VPLRRKKGSSGAFEEAVSGTDWSEALKASSTGAPNKKPPDRRALDEAQAAVRAFEDEGRVEIAELEGQRAALDKRLDQAQAAFEQRRAELVARVAAAQTAFKARGG
jgi:hypothetical protein